MVEKTSPSQRRRTVPADLAGPRRRFTLRCRAQEPTFVESSAYHLIVCHAGAISFQAPYSRHGTPEIFNTDQGSQFTSTEFIKVLAAREIKISVNGKGA